jgi:hypothetical protein
MTLILKTDDLVASPGRALSAKQYCVALLSAYIAVFCGIAAINLVVDPYGVFGTDILAPNNVNERFAKIYHLDVHHGEYDTYIFGSSTVGQTAPSIVEKYLPGNRAYNLYVTNGDISDYVAMLKYMLRRQFSVKAVIIQLDPDDFLRPASADQNDYARRQLPRVSGEPTLKFYSDYLFSFSPNYITEKIQANLGYRTDGRDVSHSGTWRNIPAEKMSPAEWILQDPTFKLNVAREYKGDNLVAKLTQLQEFLSLARGNGCATIVMTQASNHKAMDYLDVAAYVSFLSGVANLTDYWDFGGYNSITNNDENYYDIHHARPAIAALMLARIFGDESVAVPPDFGVFVTRNSVEGIVQARRQNVVNAK